MNPDHYRNTKFSTQHPDYELVLVQNVKLYVLVLVLLYY
eukprot:SAG31_NODE_67_length_28318_cov_6.493674_5_plen_39_part_00